MAKFEPWQEAYMRIRAEVAAEMPDASKPEQYREYRKRCEAWKRERGIR